MEYLQRCFCLLSLIFILIKDVHALTVSSSGSAFGLLGKNTAELVCTYTVDDGDSNIFIDWQRNASGSSTYEAIALFDPKGTASVATTSEGQAVNGRVNLTNPTAGSLTAKVLFTEIKCNDERDYRCLVSYRTSAGQTSKESTTKFEVKAKPTEPNPVVVEPSSSSVEENGSLQFTCSGNIGKPEGKYKWTKYRDSTPFPITPSTTTPTYLPSNCSFKGVSTITLTFAREDNQAVVRCTVDTHDTLSDSEAENLYQQTDKITVYYQARTPTLTKNPDQAIYYAGESTVTLTCGAEGNPAPTYKWLSPNGTVVGTSSQLVFNSMALDQAGEYTCVAENNYNSKTFNASSKVEIKIDPPTTQAPTTETPSTPTETTTSGTNTGGQKGDDSSGLSGGIIAAIAVVVVVVVLTVIIIIVVILYRKSKTRKEIDEPPEKPRNNQNLSFVGNRPDIVNNDYKNKNSPFNNQFDHGSNNQLAYADLSFDSNGSSALNLSNKPRSRMPIQLSDDLDLNGPPTTYSEVNVMPAHLPRV